MHNICSEKVINLHNIYSVVHPDLCLYPPWDQSRTKKENKSYIASRQIRRVDRV
jgi:hypothetical protein